MNICYSKFNDFVVVKENEKFGIYDALGNLVLPSNYDHISVSNGVKNGIGFIICQNGFSGYVEFEKQTHCESSYGIGEEQPNGCAVAFLPCIYPRIEAQRNGLVLYQSTDSGEKEIWYDFKSHTLHRDLRWMKNFVDFDSFLIDGIGSCMPTLKKAGEDAWVKYPQGSAIDPLREIPIDNLGVRCILCCEEIPEVDAENEQTIDGYHYSFLLLYKNGWMPTRSKRTLTELYAELPKLIDNTKSDQNNNSIKDGNTFFLFCKYKKKHEEWD